MLHLDGDVTISSPILVLHLAMTKLNLYGSIKRPCPARLHSMLTLSWCSRQCASRLAIAWRSWAVAFLQARVAYSLIGCLLSISCFAKLIEILALTSYTFIWRHSSLHFNYSTCGLRVACLCDAYFYREISVTFYNGLFYCVISPFI